jgi:hypothetical protein
MGEFVNVLLNVSPLSPLTLCYYEYIIGRGKACLARRTLSAMPKSNNTYLKKLGNFQPPKISRRRRQQNQSRPSLRALRFIFSWRFCSSNQPKSGNKLFYKNGKNGKNMEVIWMITVEEINMGTEYIMHIVSDLGRNEILELWFEGIGIQVEIKPLLNRDYISDAVGPGFVACCCNQISERSKIIRNEEFGFAPTAYITFRLFGDRSGPELTADFIIPNSIRQGVVKWLENTTGDAAFLFNYDNGIFLRKSGNLTIDPGWWLDEQLEMLTMPYSKKHYSNTFREA